MDKKGEMLDLLQRYAPLIKSENTPYRLYVGASIPDKLLVKALKNFALGIEKDTVLGYFDSTVTGSGKGGYVFTEDKIVFKEIMEKPAKLWYDDIISMHIEEKSVKNRNKLVCEISDGKPVVFYDDCISKSGMKQFLIEAAKRQRSFRSPSSKIDALTDEDFFAEAGGIAVGHYGVVNKLFEEEKFKSGERMVTKDGKQVKGSGTGHGFAAERANNIYDRLRGHDAKIVGDDNAKNGADRIVDGIEIQSKYCASGSKCINECFEDGGKGTLRYLTSDGKPMQIEVPSDKYDAAVRAMEEKIRRGQVPGISDPAEAKNIVRKGHFSYEQAKNIAKAGTIDSLKYDAVNGMIIGASAFGISTTIAFASAIWQGEEHDVALKTAALSGLKVGGTAFVTTVLASQLSKAGLNSALVGSTEAIANALGPKASAVVINAFRGSAGNIYGAAAMKSFAKLLRGNAITAVITVGVFSAVDVADIFRGRISGKQLFKNLANTTSTTIGGIGGFIAGQALIPIPAVGGLIGSVIVGGAAGKVTDTVAGKFVEDDAEEMVRIIQKVFGNLADEYLLSRKEAEKSADKLKEILNGKKLKEMYASKDRQKFARALILPLVEEEVNKRQKIYLPSEDEMSFALKDVLEAIYDADPVRV